MNTVLDTVQDGGDDKIRVARHFLMYAKRTGTQIMDGFPVICVMSVLACILALVFYGMLIRQSRV